MARNYTHRSVPCSIHIREAFSCSRWELSETTTGQCAEGETRDFAALSLRGNIFTNFPPLAKAQKTMRNRSPKDCMNQR